MSFKIPILDLKPEILLHRADYARAIERVMESGQFVGGPEGEAFEKEVAAYLNVPYAVGVNSGTDALIIGLRALGIGPGDEVLTSPFSFFATAEAISLLGATPVFCDINPHTFNIDSKCLHAKLTSKTKAILPVHLFGQSSEMQAICDFAAAHQLKVLEDAAQAFGAEYDGQKVGGLSDAGTFSFFPSKNLGAFGDAGMIVLKDPDVAAAARKLRNHGSSKRYYNDEIGYCSRLDEMQAAILRVKLPNVEIRNELRRKAAARYDELLGHHPGLQIPTVDPRAKHIYHQYTVRIHGGLRESVNQRLAERGIASMVYYPIPIHRSPVYSGTPRDLPRAEHAANEVLSLPMWPDISLEVQREVAQALFDCLA